ncbi:MAG: cupredoxin domain-containing protein [Nitrospirae bacterium]|nr:cupredoxin domain-containing protein [Candidatus Manganitrophaceae bacterium]
MKISMVLLLSLVFLAAGRVHAETFTLKTNMSDDLAFVGKDGTKNPTIEVQEGDVVELVIENGDGGPHIFTAPDINVKSSRIDTVGERTVVKFVAKKGEFKYFCPLPGHRRLGMEGTIVCRH